MSNVTVSMKMSAKQAGALYMQNIAFKEKITELEKLNGMYASDFDSLLDVAAQCATTKKAKAKLANFISDTESQHNAEQWRLAQQDIGIQRCIETLQDCYRVALDENKDIEDANSIEVLIDHVQQLRKEVKP
jgi:septal ring factor EnvC (AmiA/AmiB activator)